jgi:hypothetical protein
MGENQGVLFVSQEKTPVNPLSEHCQQAGSDKNDDQKSVASAASSVSKLKKDFKSMYVKPKRKNKNLRDSPRLHVSLDPQEFNSLLLDNLVDNGSI